MLRKVDFSEFSTDGNEIPHPIVVYARLENDPEIIAKATGKPEESVGTDWFMRNILQDNQETENTAFVEKYCTPEQKAKYKALIKKYSE